MTFEDWAAHLGFSREVRAWLHQAAPADARRALEHYKAEAKRRYRAYARKLHPDLGGDEAELKMLNVVWDVIRELEIPDEPSPVVSAPLSGGHPVKMVSDLAQLLVSCWRLGGSDTIPTSHAVLDRALARAVQDQALPDWAREHLNFSESRIGVQCVELPVILDWAQKAQLTAAPNPSYQTVKVLVSETVASKLLRRLGVTEANAKQWGEALRAAVADIARADQESPTTSRSVEY